MSFYDDLETRSADARAKALSTALPDLIARAKGLSGYAASLGDVDPYKIKTVGDEYMVAAGVPSPRTDHAHAIAELALRMQDHCAQHQFYGHKLHLRVGINSGPVVAGIVGTHKFAYDLWGDVVNTASRMESHGVAGSIQISGATYQLIRDEYVCEPRGPIQVKGKNQMETYFLLARRGGVHHPPRWLWPAGARCAAWS